LAIIVGIDESDERLKACVNATRLGNLSDKQQWLNAALDNYFDTPIVQTCANRPTNTTTDSTAVQTSSSSTKIATPAVVDLTNDDKDMQKAIHASISNDKTQSKEDQDMVKYVVLNDYLE
jgi:hypothetical protein